MNKKVLLLPLIALLNTNFANAAQPKHVAVPPESINQQKLPNAENKGLLSHSTMIPIRSSNHQTLNNANSVNTQEVIKNIYFDGQASNPLIFLSPNSEEWKITATSPSGKLLIDEIKDTNSSLKTKDIQIGGQIFAGKSISLPASSEGIWRVKLTKQNKSNTQSAIRGNENNHAPEGYLTFKGDKQFKLYSYLDNNFTTKDSNINIVAYMIDTNDLDPSSKKPNKKQALQSSINRAFVDIVTPSKKHLSVVLTDDGLNGDKLAGDGLFSAKIPTDETGVYTSQVQVEGIRPDGVRFSRTTTDLYPIEEASFRFTNTAANLKQLNDSRSLISIPVKQLTSVQSVYMSAEIWGTSKKGSPQSAAWVGGLASPISIDNQTHLQLSLDNRWLKRKGLQAPYSLKSVRLQNGSTNVPIAEKNYLPLNVSLQHAAFINNKTTSKFSANIDNNEIVPEMLTGNAPTNFSPLSYTSGTGSKLLLVHGYCSDKVWNTSNFTNSAEFQDYNKNRSHDDFAQRIISFGSAYNSYGIVAHSQGGAAALHMYARYWTGLDNATGGQLIQSVGTPYRGTALAGNLAALGDVFGIGCGVNTDLTYSGAANWLATVPSWARSKVDYYTTSFTDKWWRYDYCHLATDLFLDDPEDGTTEKWAGQLSGGVNKGHKTGWCHTNGMRDTAQFKDSSRNSSMNSRAAR